MDSDIGLRLFDVNSLSEAVGSFKSSTAHNCTLPGGTAIQITPVPGQRRRLNFFLRFRQRKQPLCERVTVQIGAQTFDMRVSGSGDKLRVGGKVGSGENAESFNNAFDAMKRCSNPTEKLCLLNLMISLDPKRAKSELMQNGGDLGIFEGLFDQRGRPGDALIALDNFEEYLGEKGIDTVQSKGMIQSIYENLKLGHLSHKVHGGERERLDFSQSNFARGNMGVLYEIAERTRRFRSSPIAQSVLRTSYAGMEFPERSTIRFDSSRETFVNADRTMEAWLNVGKDNDGNPEKMSINDGLFYGLITPETAQQLRDQRLDSFTPLYVSFRCTAQLADFGADIRNIMNGVPQNVRDADVLAETIIDKLQPGVVPIFTGHSMGGMLAHAVGAKRNYASIGFNPLGLGTGIREWIDMETEGGGGCQRANDVNHAGCHPTFAMQGDWVSDEEGSRVANVAVKKSYLGQRFMMEMKVSEEEIHRDQHNSFAENIKQHRDYMHAENIGLFEHIDFSKGGNKTVNARLTDYLSGPDSSDKNQMLENLWAMPEDGRNYIANRLKKEAEIPLNALNSAIKAHELAFAALGVAEKLGNGRGIRGMKRACERASKDLEQARKAFDKSKSWEAYQTFLDFRNRRMDELALAAFNGVNLPPGVDVGRDFYSIVTECLMEGTINGSKVGCRDYDKIIDNINQMDESLRKHIASRLSEDARDELNSVLVT
jgi:hypothetical protein